MLAFLLLAGKSDKQLGDFYFIGSSGSKQQPAVLPFSDSHSIMDASPVSPHSLVSPSVLVQDFLRVNLPDPRL